MSANNQTLVQEFKGRWYVFENVQAESWVYYDEESGKFDDTRINNLPLERATQSFPTRDEALARATDLDDEAMGRTEYGVHVNYLAKDFAVVKIVTANNQKEI